MDSLYDQLKHFSDLGTAVSLTQTLISIGLSFVLSMVISLLYQKTYRGPSFSPAFMQTLVLCGITVTMVMLIIGSNIARAFSLVGALSIIRFRNAVKDPRDVAFIFLAMAVGMGCGTYFYQLTMVFTAFVTGCVYLLTWLHFGETDVQERLLRIEAPATPGFEKIFDEVLKGFARRFSLLSVGTSRMGTEVELQYALTTNTDFNAEALISELRKINHNLRIEISGTSHLIDL